MFVQEVYANQQRIDCHLPVKGKLVKDGWTEKKK